MISDIPGIELKKTYQESLPIQFTFQISYFVASFPKLTPLLVKSLQALLRKLSKRHFSKLIAEKMFSAGNRTFRFTSESSKEGSLCFMHNST